MRRAWLLLVLLLAADRCLGSPADAVGAALADARRLGLAAPYARYLYHPAPPRAFREVLLGHINGLSREADYARLRVVRPGLWVLDLRDLDWDPKVYEKLAVLDPYFHTKVEEATNEYEVVEHEYGNFYGWDGRPLRRELGGRWKTTEVVKERVRKRGYRKKALDALFVPGARPADLKELVALTKSACPLLRADWFFLQTARQLDRNQVATGAGYYDFLRIKNEADLEALAGIDRKKAAKARREIAAIIADSGVSATGSRQVLRPADGYWETHDAKKNVQESNSVRQLDGDFVFQAKEVYFRLPNGLWGLAAVKADDGTLQNAVPPDIAGDRESTSNDLQVHPGLSCIRCHAEGLRPLSDYARAFYKDPPGDARLQSPDYEKLKRLRQLYLSPMLTTYYDVDQLIYTRALFGLTGLTPQQYSRAYGRVWRESADTSVTGERFALELGTTLPELKKALTAAAVTQGQLDPVLTGFLKVPEFRAKREHVEEVYPAAALIVGGHVAP